LNSPIQSARLGGDGEWSAEDARVSGLHEGRDYYWSYGSNVLIAEVAPGTGAAVASDLPGHVPDPG